MAQTPQSCHTQFRAAFSFAALFLPVYAAHGQEPPERCFTAPAPVAISDISTHGDLILGSGQRLRLADIALPETGRWRQSALDALKAIRGQDAAASLELNPDRWGLHQASLTLGGNDLAKTLVAQGLATVNPGEAAYLCNSALLAEEQHARKNRIGLWIDAANQPVMARDPEALQQRIGRFTLVEGRILNVGVREKWTYLNFGRNWKKDFTATISAKVWAQMQKAGLTADALKGKRVLLRGVVREWNGPSLEIRTPEMLEILNDIPDRT